MKTNNYKQSFLLFWHIVLTLGLTFFTYLVNIEYIRQDKIEGSIASIAILILYLLLLNHTVKLFKKSQVGLAHFLTVSGFLIASFVQIATCSNVVSFAMH